MSGVCQIHRYPDPAPKQRGVLRRFQEIALRYNIQQERRMHQQKRQEPKHLCLVRIRAQLRLYNTRMSSAPLYGHC